MLLYDDDYRPARVENNAWSWYWAHTMGTGGFFLHAGGCIGWLILEATIDKTDEKVFFFALVTINTWLIPKTSHESPWPVPQIIISLLYSYSNSVFAISTIKLLLLLWLLAPRVLITGKCVWALDWLRKWHKNFIVLHTNPASKKHQTSIKNKKISA